MNGKKTNISTGSSKGKEKLLSILDKSLSTGTTSPIRSTGTRLYGHVANNNAVHTATSSSTTTSYYPDKPNSITVDPRNDRWKGKGKGKGKGKSKGKKHFGSSKGRGKVSVGQQGNGRKHTRTPRSTPVRNDRGMVGIASYGKQFELKTKFKSSSSSNKNTIIEGTELVNNITVPSNIYQNMGSICYELDLNPILMNKTKLGQYGKLNEFFRFDYIDIHMEGAGASLDRGNLGVALSIDPEVKFNKPGIDNVRALLSLPYCKQMKTWREATLSFKHQLNKFYAIKPTGDPRLWDQGKFILFVYSGITVDGNPSPLTLGNIWINYKVQFKSSVMQDAIPGGGDITAITSCAGTFINLSAGDEFSMSSANLNNSFVPDGIYQLLVTSAFTANGAAVVLGTDTNPTPINVGTCWFLKRNTEMNRWLFYSTLPSADPIETEGAMVLNNPTGIPNAATVGGAFKAFYVTTLNQ